MKKDTKSIVITIFLIVSVITIFFTFKTFRNKQLKELPEVKLKEIKREKSLAVMISNENGIGYKEYEGEDWPGNGYKYKEARCVDNSGSEVKEKVTYEDGKVTLTTNKTMYCTLYFDKSIIIYLRNNDKKNSLSSTIQGDMYRYQGTKEMVDNNYICFGTNNQEECKNDPDHYMYRIIGVDKNDNLKLIKETFLKEEDNRGFAWNDTLKMNTTESTNCPNNKCPDWPESKIFKRINGISNGDKIGNGQFDGGNTDIFVDSEEYSYLKSGDSINGGNNGSDWYNLIEEHEWLYGETKEGYITSKHNGDLWYEIESGKAETWHTVLNGDEVKSVKYKWTQKIKSKISLLYLHDYFYSYYDGVNEETRGKEVSAEKMGDSWLYYGQNSLNNLKSEWSSVKAGLGWFGDALPPSDESSWLNYQWIDPVMVTWSLVDVSMGNTTGHNSPLICYGIRPVFYLLNTIKIVGNGTTDFPYLINTEEI